MPLFRRKRQRETARKKRYLTYFKAQRAAGRVPLTYVQWIKQGEPTTRTRKVSGGLRAAGLSEADIRRLRGR